jgi:hypothetical protein
LNRDGWVGIGTGVKGCADGIKWLQTAMIWVVRSMSPVSLVSARIRVTIS